MFSFSSPTWSSPQTKVCVSGNEAGISHVTFPKCSWEVHLGSPAKLDLGAFLPLVLVGNIPQNNSPSLVPETVTGVEGGAQGLPLTNLERGDGLKDRSYRVGGRGQRMVINFQGLGAHLSPRGFWLAACHLFLWLKCRLHSFLSQASRLPSLLRPSSLWLAVWKHLAQRGSNFQSAKGSARVLLADSTLFFSSSLSHESPCLESSWGGFIWLRILSPELGILAYW